MLFENISFFRWNFLKFLVKSEKSFHKSFLFKIEICPKIPFTFGGESDQHTRIYVKNFYMNDLDLLGARNTKIWMPGILPSSFIAYNINESGKCKNECTNYMYIFFTLFVNLATFEHTFLRIYFSKWNEPRCDS